MVYRDCALGLLLWFDLVISNLKKKKRQRKTPKPNNPPQTLNYSETV